MGPGRGNWEEQAPVKEVRTQNQLVFTLTGSQLKDTRSSRSHGTSRL
jgi:hypothetical protein